MTYIKNITGAQLDLSILGIYLAIDEVRDLAEFTTRDELERKASVIIDYINNDSIIFLDADLNIFDKVSALQFVVNGYSKVSIIEGSAPVITTSTAEAKKFYFVKAAKLQLTKGETVTKTFLGDLHVLELYTKYSDVELTISMNGLVFPTETLQKYQSFSFSFDGLAENVSISLKSTKYSKTIEIYMDGKSNAVTADLQTFIDSWGV